MADAVQIRCFVPADTAAVIALWQACGLTRPWNDPRRDITRKLAVQADGFLVAVDGESIVGSVMVGYEGHRAWINYLAVDPARRHHGLGRRLMDAAEAYALALDAPKMNLQLRAGNDGAALFYERIGYVRDTALSFGKRLVEDGPRLSEPVTAIGDTLVLASRNAKKLKEMQALFAPLGITLRLVPEFSDIEPEETGSTFVENALIKARHAAKVSGLPALADDSGLEVAALNGAPGVYSARYAGTPSSDAANNEKLLHALRDVPPAQRGARFVSVLALLRHADDPVPLIAHGFWSGRMLDAPRGAHGFGYDPLFWVPGHDCSSAELTPETKNRVSHRARASAELLRLLRESGIGNRES